MRVLKILINNQEVDIDKREDFPLLLKKQVLTFAQIDSRGDVTSFTVQFPATQNNLNIFGLNFNLDNRGKFNNTEPYNTEIFVNSLSILKGVFILTAYGKTGIQGFIKSNTIAWSTLINQKKLTDLQFDPVPFYGMETILKSQSDQIVDPVGHSNDNVLVFPLVAYGAYSIPFKQTPGYYIDTTDTTIALQNKLINPLEVNKLTYSDIPPSFYVRAIIRQIFSDIGYTVLGSQIDSEELDTLIIPYTANKQVKYNQGTLGGYKAKYIGPTNSYFASIYSNYPSNNNFVFYGSFDVPIAGLPNTQQYTENHGLNHIFYTADEYKNTVNSLINWNTSTQVSPTSEISYNFSLNFNFETQAVGTIGIYPKIALIKIGTDVDNLVDTVLGQSVILNPELVIQEQELPMPTVGTYTQNLTANVNFTPSKGDRYRLVIFQQLSPNYLFNINASNTIEYQIKANYTNEFIIQDNLPADSQLEFIKDFISLYNLYIIEDTTNKTIYFETQDNFYNPVETAIELKGKYLSSEQTLTNSKLEFNYNYDSGDFLVTGDTDQNYTYDLNLRTKDNPQTIQLGFSKTEMQKFFLVTKNVDVTSVNFQINQQLMSSTAPYVYKENFSIKESIDIPMITTESGYNSPQNDVQSEPEIRLVGTPAQNIPFQGKVTQGYVPQNLKFQRRLLRLKSPYVLHTYVPFIYQDTFTNSATIIRLLTMTAATNLNLDWNYFYEKYQYNYVLELEQSEVVSFSVYMDYTDYAKIESNTLIKIDGIYYRLINFAPYNVINPKPLTIKLLPRI